MKTCPKCQSTYSDESLNFCLADGSLLSSEHRNVTINSCVAISALLLLTAQGVAVRAQPRSGHSRPLAGSICVAPPDRPTTGEKSLANPAGGNPVSTYSIQVDKMSPVIASSEKPVRIASISTSRKHLVKIIGDGKVVQSFWLNFGKFKTNDLCLFFNSLYETWSLWDGKEGRAICKCK